MRRVDLIRERHKELLKQRTPRPPAEDEDAFGEDSLDVLDAADTVSLPVEADDDSWEEEE